MCNNSNQDVVNVNAYAKFGQIPSSHLKILSGNEILTSIKDHNTVSIWWKLTRNNPILELVNINASVKFGRIPLICFQDIERKRNSDKNYGSPRAIPLLLYDENWRVTIPT